MRTALFKRLEELYPQMVELRRELHRHPELSFHEVHTPKRIAEFYENLHMPIRTEVGGRGVVAVLEGALPGKTVALRADFDALPINDEKDVPYKSTVPGVMHACGHDGHTSTLLHLAKALNEQRDQLAGRVVFIHQFAEEITPGGAKPMIEDGCLDGVDVLFGTHLWSGFPTGTVAYKTGRIMAAADSFEIVVKGRGGHGGIPHEAVDSIVIASQLVTQLQQIVSRFVDPGHTAVLSIGSFHAGSAFNVISETATLKGTVRTFDRDVREKIIALMERMIKGTCESSGADYRFTYNRGYPPVVNHEKETMMLKEAAQRVGNVKNVVETEALMIGEDVAYYLEKVPGTFFLTGSGNKELLSTYPHHHPMFDLDETAMLIAAQTLGEATLSYLEQHRYEAEEIKS
ncbi:M20 family metallopeptidase [Pseudalkalibacillus hwajinpoensis]|uniref:M20 family metallopeptidase n=1 Tax=Guptibacillus hwajinpoensis TaxID=208199 RepID=UPI001CD2CC6A|nr:M20 family metallopeptidase [Pseudalkalibacillus hwajinpoensis]MCA0989840.1 M20 family metallopeptidase [Pseudalkalibacillus hwajinpoensis]